MYLSFSSEIFFCVRGGLLVLFLFHVIIYLQSRQKTYLYYSLFLLGIFLYITLHIYKADWINPIYVYLKFSLQFFVYAAYTIFARLILETKENSPKWDKYLKTQTKTLVIIAGLFILIQFLFGYQYQLKTFIIIAPFLTIFTTVSLYYLYKIPGITSKYFVVGSLIYVILANVSFLEFILGTEYFIKKDFEPMTFVYLGALIQSIVFASILGFSITNVEQKNVRAEMLLAKKLKEMEELKMTALQSQMNPHFLFNSLNSINNFVLKNEVEKASDYITKFSRLIRIILKSSSNSTIPLSEELGFLSLYVKLEQMRINGGFEYIVNIDESINLEEVKVPPLFLQPFIENSIWHGIMYVSSEKKIQLSIHKKGKSIECVIIDNGIGINKTKDDSHKKIKRRKFFGTQATENRIKLLHKNIGVDVKIKDISNNTSTGTKVTILFPLIKS